MYPSADRSWQPEEPVLALEPKPEPELEPVLEAEPEPEPEATPVEVKHPAADDAPPFPLADPGEYYIGLWSGLPNFGCPYCGYATLSGSDAVEIHILSKIEQGHTRHLKALEIKST